MKLEDNKINWNWLGGFFDGEGYAGFVSASTYMYYRRKKDGTRKIVPYKVKPRLQVSIGQKEIYILEEIKKFLGYGYIKKKGNSWYCNSAKARRFLKAILPYIKTKHKTQQVIKVLKLDNKNIIPKKEKNEIF